MSTHVATILEMCETISSQFLEGHHISRRWSGDLWEGQQVESHSRFLVDDSGTTGFPSVSLTLSSVK